MNITKMAKKKNMNNRRILNFVSVLSLFLMFSFAFMPSVIAQDDFVITPVGSEDNNCQIGEVYLQDRGCIKPQFNADFNVFPTPEGKISSSLGEIQAIRINNPYAAGGQPVVVEFTLQNIGDQLGYPFDKIDLPADVYALQLAVDKDIQVVMADGRYDTNDVESLVSKYSVNGTITKVELVGVGTWKENAYGDKSFNEAELKSKECSHEGSTYDSKLNDCVQIEAEVEEEPIGELEI